MVPWPFATGRFGCEWKSFGAPRWDSTGAVMPSTVVFLHGQSRGGGRFEGVLADPAIYAERPAQQDGAPAGASAIPRGGP